ncbi:MULTISPECIES: fimbrial biogenesis chaperone [Delftia]|jgi:P pilus assembly chaperone PapD|uniref:fimbrial biogenesis chaperone n=1 Tax=Delftia TaxID=80865 RepID=UPI001E2BFD68|nr:MULTISPECIES: fimbria/pilus periplasmic chaperone [Delftia]
MLAMASLLLCAISAHASIILYGTRVVFPGAETEVTLKIFNKGKRPVLAQSWLDRGDEGESPDSIEVPFVVTPSLTRMEPGDQQMLRIIHSGQALPQDRESLFWLNVLDVPPKVENQKDSSGALALAFRTRIKLMYRPEGLPGKPRDAPKQLQWITDTVEDGQIVLKAHNMTAYIANLGRVALEAGGKTFEAGVGQVLPGETATFAFISKANKGEHPPPQPPSGAAVVYTSVDDWGGTEGHRVELAR